MEKVTFLPLLCTCVVSPRSANSFLAAERKSIEMILISYAKGPVVGQTKHKLNAGFIDLHLSK